MSSDLRRNRNKSSSYRGTLFFTPCTLLRTFWSLTTNWLREASIRRPLLKPWRTSVTWWEPVATREDPWEITHPKRWIRAGDFKNLSMIWSTAWNPLNSSPLNISLRCLSGSEKLATNPPSLSLSFLKNLTFNSMKDNLEPRPKSILSTSTMQSTVALRDS